MTMPESPGPGELPDPEVSHGRHAAEPGSDAWSGLLVDGRYELHAVRPAAGLCWGGHDHLLDRAVAVRASRATEESRRSLMAEGRQAAVVEHPGLLRVHDIAVWQDRVWLITEFLEGRTLAEILDRGELLGQETVEEIGERLGAALDALHRVGLVHGSVGPQDVVLDPTRGAVLARFPGETVVDPAADRSALDALLADLAAPDQPAAVPFDALIQYAA